MKQLEFGKKNIRLRWAGVKEYFWEYLEAYCQANCVWSLGML